MHTGIGSSGNSGQAAEAVLPQDLRAEVSRLQVAATALTAVAAAIDARVSGSPLDPTFGPAVDGLLDALGLRDAISAASPAELTPLLGEIRALLLTDTRLLFARTRQAGWGSADADLLRAAGDVSIGFPRRLRTVLAPELDGLSARLDADGAAFLDVGTGVARLAIEMARLWPRLRVVGIDPFGPALAIAREEVDRASLADRVALRAQAGQDLPDREAFDLVWVAGAFVPAEVVPRLVERLHQAIRPGGWLVYATVRQVDDPLLAALSRLRSAQLAGSSLRSDALLEQLRGAGFTELRLFPGPPTSFTALVAARR